MTAAVAPRRALLIWAPNSVMVTIVLREVSPRRGLVIARGYVLSWT